MEGETAWRSPTLRRALLVAPLVFAVHNLEESVAMGRWSVRDLPGLLDRARGAVPRELLTPGARDLLDRLQPPSAFEFAVGAAIATAVPAMVYWAATARGPGSLWTRVAVWLQALFFVNIFLPHLAATIWLGRYTPGVVSALVLTLPLSLVVFRGALQEGVVTRRALIAFGASAVIGVVAIVLALLAIGRMVAGVVGH